MPQFRVGESKAAKATMRNPTAKAFDYDGVILMGTNLVEVSRVAFHLNAGEEKLISFPIVMPVVVGVYPVYIGVFSGGQSIALYKATEDVAIVPLSVDPNIASLSLAWTSGAITCPVNSGQTAYISYWLITTVTKETELTYIPYIFEVDLVLAGVVKASGVSISVSWNIGSPLSVAMTMPSTPGVYDVIIKAYRGSVLTGTYPMGQLTVYAIPEQSNLSYENLSFEKVYYYSSFQSLHVECDIRNIGNTTITRVVSLWAKAPSYYPGVSYRSSWYEVALYWNFLNSPPWSNTPTISLTLAPGQVFHYVFVGDFLVFAQYYVQLRDNMGGKSAELTCA